MAWAKGRPHVACEKGPRCLLEFGFYLWLGEPQDPTTRERMRAARAPQVWAPGQGQRVGLEPKDQVPMLPPPPLAVGWSRPSLPGLMPLI